MQVNVLRGMDPRCEVIWDMQSGSESICIAKLVDTFNGNISVTVRAKLVKLHVNAALSDC